jgi:hypothetical protein
MAARVSASHPSPMTKSSKSLLVWESADSIAIPTVATLLCTGRTMLQCGMAQDY